MEANTNPTSNQDLGIYERELYPTVEEAIAAKYPLIVDIGAAEGYYAVGMAMRSPQSQVIAYEMDPRGQALLRDMIAINQQLDGATTRPFVRRRIVILIYRVHAHNKLIFHVHANGIRYLILCYWRVRNPVERLAINRFAHL